MKILFSTYSLAFQNPGGGERVLLALQAELARRGHQVDLYDPWQHDPAEYDLIHHFSTLENAFWAHCKRRAPGVPLVVTATSFSPDRLAGIAARAKRVALSSLRRLSGRPVEDLRARLRLPDLWLSSTETEAKDLIHSYGIPGGKIAVLPNGVESQFAQGDPELIRKRLGIAGPFVLHVGRFHPVKNHLMLLDALRITGSEAVFIGDPDLDRMDYFNACTRVAKKLGRIHILQGVSHDDPLLASAYAAAGAFVLPSQFETFGIAALEAAIAGAPLILTREMRTRPLFEAFAQFVNPEDPHEIAAAIRKAFSGDSPRPKAEDRKSLMTTYSWPAITEKLEALYLSAVPARDSRH